MELLKDTVEYIAHRLSVEDLLHLSKTCKSYQYLFLVEGFWLRLTKEKFPFTRNKLCLRNYKFLTKFKGVISIAVCGANKSGKTTFITRFKTGSLVTNYKPTPKITLRNILAFTNKGNILMEVIEYPGNTIPNIDHDVVLIFCKPATTVVTKLPTIWICSFSDINPHPVFPVHNQMRWQISSVSMYNYDKPFLYALREKFGNDVQWDSRVA